MKRLLFTLLVCAIPALAAGTVTSSISSIGPTVSVLQFNWTGDAVNGSVPSTAAVSLLSVQGYYISNVQIRPLTPAPTSGYAVTVTDGRGADILSGLGGSLSASATANFAPSSAVPPLVGGLTINLTGNAVASAQGQVLVYFTKPGTVNLGMLNQQSSGTSNSGRLGYTYTAESFGAAGTCASDDTAFIQAGINALQGTGATLWLSGCYKTTSALNVSSAGNITFDGGGTIKPYVSGAAYNALQILGYNGTSTTVTTNISLANRAFPSTNVVGVTSVGAFSVGGYVFMNYNDGTYTFGQVSQVQGIAGNNLTLVDPLYIPMTSGVTTITPLVMSPSVKVKNLTFDGSNFSPNAYSFALETGNTVDLDMEGLTYKNFSQTAFAAATYITVGYKTISNRERVYNSGSVGYDQLNYVYQSNMEGSNIIASNGPASTGAFGIGLWFVINSSFSNIQSMGSYSRELKLLGCGYNNFTNINLGNSPHATLLSIAVGSYRNRFHNVVTVYAPTGIGVWFSDQSNIYNVVDGVTSLGSNANYDISFGVSDTNNSVINAAYTTHISSIGFNNSISFTGGLSNVSMYCTGAEASNTTVNLNAYQQSVCNTNTGGTNQSIIIPRNGMIQNLYVTADVAGVNASDGVVTVIMPGLGASPITCTIGTGTSCSDVTHMYPVAAGTLLGVTLASQTGGTVSNVKVMFQY